MNQVGLPGFQGRDDALATTSPYGKLDSSRDVKGGRPDRGQDFFVITFVEV